MQGFVFHLPSSLSSVPKSVVGLSRRQAYVLFHLGLCLPLQILFVAINTCEVHPVAYLYLYIYCIGVYVNITQCKRIHNLKRHRNNKHYKCIAIAEYSNFLPNSERTSKQGRTAERS